MVEHSKASQGLLETILALSKASWGVSSVFFLDASWAHLEHLASWNCREDVWSASQDIFRAPVGPLESLDSSWELFGLYGRCLGGPSWWLFLVTCFVGGRLLGTRFLVTPFLRFVLVTRFVGAGL